MDATFGALSDPTRRQIVARLLEGEATVSELAAPHDMSLPAILKHVGKLVDAGLVIREKRGRTVVCSLNIDPLGEANAWLQRNLDAWNRRFDALDAYLARQKEGET
jgi:DNA-binding transcriptional ArsR family regulator